jgi:DNA-directed RNA polymerase specialized sigma24 family protein
VKLNVERPQNLSSNDVLVTRALYYRYSSWLLGYLMTVVKDYDLAEQYLVDVFKEVPNRLPEFTGSESNPWLCLQQLAKSKLKNYTRTLRSGVAIKDQGTAERLRFDSYVNAMTTEQQIVFCGVYYYQKPTALLAQELNKADDEVKKILKEAFLMIKNG